MSQYDEVVKEGDLYSKEDGSFGEGFTWSWVGSSQESRYFRRDQGGSFTREGVKKMIRNVCGNSVK